MMFESVQQAGSWTAGEYQLRVSSAVSLDERYATSSSWIGSDISFFKRIFEYIT